MTLLPCSLVPLNELPGLDIPQSNYRYYTSTSEINRHQVETNMSTITLPSSLSKVQITTLPNSVYYISTFITPLEEEYLLNKVKPPTFPTTYPIQKTLNQKPSQITSQPLTSWRTLIHRRLQVYPAALTPSGELQKSPLPPWLEEPLISRLLALPLSDSTPASGKNVFTDSPHQRPNHVLINEYPPGIGITPHEDGPAYFPLVATVSLAGQTVLDIYGKNETTGKREPKWRLLQERRSLLITTGDVYRETLHGIGDLERDCELTEATVENWNLLREETREACLTSGGCLERKLRISATIRDVVKVRDYARFVPSLGGRR